jgi:hypothetical protein
LPKTQAENVEIVVRNDGYLRGLGESPVALYSKKGDIHLTGVLAIIPAVFVELE